MINKKKIGILGTAVLALACTAGGVTTAASANENTAQQDYASFAMLDGASVRIKDDYGSTIRFTTRIARSDLHAAVGGEENLVNAKVVTMITPTRYLDALGKTDFLAEDDLNGEAEGSGFQAIDIRALDYVKNEDFIHETDESIVKGDYYYFNACLHNIAEENLTRKFSAKSYLLVGETIVDYTAFDYEKNSRDIWDVASQAVNDYQDNPEVDDDPYDYLSELSSTFDVTVGDYTKTVKRGERLAWYADELKANFDKKEDVANLTYSYYRGLNDYDDTQSVGSDLTLTAKYDVVKFVENGDGTYSVSTGHTLNAGAEIVVPETFNGGSVTAVAAKAFANSTELTKIVLPESVTTIAMEAFWRNSNLTYISMTGVTALTSTATDTTIESQNAFFGCKSLTNIVLGEAFRTTGQVFKWRDNDGTMPEDHTVNLYTTAIREDEASLSIGNVSSGHNNLLTNRNVYYASENGKCAGWVYTDESKTAVETKTPHNNENGSCTVCGKTEVTNGLVYEWNGADGYTLTNGRNASGEVEILAEYGDGIHPVAPVTAIAAYAFSYQQVSAGTSNTALTGVIIPESVTTIGGSAFYRCTKLETLTLPASVTTISSDLLGMCTALTYLDMRYITATSDNNEMRSCRALETVIVNANLTVSSGMFSASSSYPAPNPKILTAYVWTDGETMPDETCKFVTSYKKNTNNVLVKEGGFCYYNKDKICAENTWYFADNGEIALVENTEHSWVSGACEHCGTAYVCTEHSYDENGKCSMCGAYNTQGVIYTWNGTGYTVTDGKAASGAVTILPYYNDGENGEKAVTAIGESAFYQGSGIDNSALTSIDIPNTVTSIGKTAFARCTGLTKVVLPESVTSLGTESFWRCTNLAYMSMTGVTDITSSTCGSNIFLSCNSLKTLVVGSSLYIGIQIASTTNLSQVGQCTVYVSATQENAGSVYVYHNEVVGETTITGSPNNALLKDEFVYMSTSETESGWYFDENGDIQIRTVE